MSWNGAGTFNRLFSWSADKAAGLDISASRMDADTNNITSDGLGNCLTRDGQGQPTALLPMAGFRHTGVQNAVNRTDYAAFGQVQDGLPNWTIAGGTADALTATYTPAITVLSDGQLCFLRATSANATTTPTFAPNGLTARTITKLGGSAVAVADIAGSLAEIILRYNAANTRWELLNPSAISNNTLIASISTGVVWLTLASSPPTGWLMFDDGTFGSATSGSSNSNSALNQALFNILFAAPFTDATCPLLTSTGAGTTRAGQGSAAAAWAANCRMTLPKTLGRALGVAGAGSGLTSRTMGLGVGAETAALVTANLPAYTPTGTVAVTAHISGSAQGFAVSGGGTSLLEPGVGTATVTIDSATFTGVAQGGTATAFSIVQPENFMNAIVKQ